MRRARLLALAVVSFSLLAVGQCPPPTDGSPGNPLEAIKQRLGKIEAMLGSTKRAVCDLYVKTGNEGMLPKFCPEPTGPCDEPIEPGPCRAYIPRYGFDAETGQCEEFIYGGCQGNGNNFRTLGE